MANAHTPRPCTAKRTPASAYFDWSVEAKAGPGRTMSIGVDTDNTEADARLIAAAPDMLATLREARVWLLGLAGSEKRVAQIDEVIAKAEA